jgi:glycosyltransferase involved in cell wall biosynthesis
MRTKKLKIAIFHFGFFYSGGGERLVLEEMKGLKQRGHEVVCFAPVLDRQTCFPDLIKEFDIRPLFPQLPKWFPDREALQVLASCVLFPLLTARFLGFDVIMATCQPGVWFGWLTKKILGKPYLVHLNQPARHLYPRKVDLEDGIKAADGPTLHRPLLTLAKPLVSWLDKKSIKEADFILVNGMFTGKKIKRIYQREVINCPAGSFIPPKVFSKNRWQGSLKIGKKKIKKPYILLTNRHFAQKRFEYALFCLPQVLEKVPGVSLAITGKETSYTKYLKILTRRLGIEEKVLFLGLVSEKDLVKLYQEAAIYVYTSPEEDFGLGVVEAMATGTPVVAFRSGGPIITVKNGETGFLAKPFEIEDFSQKIIKVLKNKQLAKSMGREGQKKVKEKFTFKKHCQILEEYLFKAFKFR